MSFDNISHPSDEDRVTRFREAIRKAIERRLASGEPLTVRSIRSEAGGGSNNTIIEEIKLATVSHAERLLSGHQGRSALERLRFLEQRLVVLTRENTELQIAVNERDKTIEGLKNVIDSASGPKGIVMDRITGFEERMMLKSDAALAETRRLLEHAQKMIASMPTEGVQRVVEKDPLTEKRYQRLIQDHASLIERHNALRARFFRETGVDPDE